MSFTKYDILFIAMLITLSYIIFLSLGIILSMAIFLEIEVSHQDLELAKYISASFILVIFCSVSLIIDSGIKWMNNMIPRELTSELTPYFITDIGMFLLSFISFYCAK